MESRTGTSCEPQTYGSKRGLIRRASLTNGKEGLCDKEITVKNITKNLGMLLLAVWLIVTGLLQIVKLPIPDLSLMLALLAVAAGVLILLQRTERQGRSRWGF
jgi:hypothetical protein